MREPGPAGNPGPDVLQPGARQDRDAVPRRLTVHRDLVAAVGQLGAEQLGERLVGELGLLQAHDVRLRSSSHGSSRGRRCLTELTFQVAIRTGLHGTCAPPSTRHRRGECPRWRRVRAEMPDVQLSDRRRVAALRDMGLLTDTPEEAYDRFTRLAAQICEAPIALFTVITEDEQFFRSQVGLPEPVATTRRTPLSHSFCQYVILSSAPLEVEDARVHPVVMGNPAIEELKAIAYLGVPLITRRGETLGSLCAVDHEPREWTDRDRSVLRDLAAATVTEIELRRTTREAVDLASRLEAALRGGKERPA